jgi:hypothetical protein
MCAVAVRQSGLAERSRSSWIQPRGSAIGLRTRSARSSRANRLRFRLGIVQQHSRVCKYAGEKERDHHVG